MRKISKLSLVLLLVLTSVSFAFASDLSEDIEDKNVKKAVGRLEALDIIKGTADGKYHPEEEVTREQFIVIVVRALGLETAASNASKASNISPKFSDIETDRWSLGYIEVGAGLGIVKGMEDGSFAPSKTISYAEILTILVRSLGYRDEFLPGSWRDEFLPGTWPDSSIDKAVELGITENVNFDNSELANRGSIAILVNNTLDLKVIHVETYDANSIRWKISDQSFLEDRQEIDVYNEVQIVENYKTDDSLKEDEVKVKFLKDTEDSKYKKDTVETFKTNSKIDLNKMLEQESIIYIDKDSNIIYAEKPENQEKQD